MAKKRVLKFECPNCNTKSQDRFLAMHDDKPLLQCTNCDSRFSSRVIERIYYMGLSHGKQIQVNDVPKHVREDYVDKDGRLGSSNS